MLKLPRKFHLKCSPFDFDDYREFFKCTAADLSDMKSVWSCFANAANCYPTYLSQVIRGTANLNPSQLFGILKFLNLADDEIDHLLILRELSNSKNQAFNQFLRSKAKKLRDTGRCPNDPLDVLRNWR